MSEKIQETVKPLLMTARQAALVLGLSLYSFNELVRRKVIIPCAGFKSRRRYSEREIMRYAFNEAKTGFVTVKE